LNLDNTSTIFNLFKPVIFKQLFNFENLDKKSELTNKLYNDLTTKIEDLEVSTQQDIKKTKLDTDKINASLKTYNEKCEELQNNFTRENKTLKNEVNQIMSNIGELKDSTKGEAEKQNKVQFYFVKT
jgi:DNA repair exonuclease SbcCD ATPase subunit